MSPLETAGIFVGIPLLVILLFASVTVTKKSPHPATYNMNDGWTHDPILWAAVDEKIGAGHGGHGNSHDSHGASSDVIGGSASGKW